jgi:hypothetical protein
MATLLKSIAAKLQKEYTERMIVLLLALPKFYTMVCIHV